MSKGQEAREMLADLDERLRACFGQPITAEEAYDSFYREIVASALASPTVGGELTDAQIDELFERAASAESDGPFSWYVSGSSVGKEDIRNFARLVADQTERVGKGVQPPDGETER